jgi:hypothetical protein
MSALETCREASRGDGEELGSRSVDGRDEIAKRRIVVPIGELLRMALEVPERTFGPPGPLTS